MRFQFIEDHRGKLPVKRMCEILKVSRSGYYAWCARPPSEREMANQELLEQIKIVHRESDKTYGSPRIYHALLRLGWKCSRNRVARLMRRNGIQAKQKRCFRSTTKRNKTQPTLYLNSKDTCSF